MQTASMFPDTELKAVPFSGAAFDATRDKERLTRQVDCIAAVAGDGAWRTITKLAADLRKRFPSVHFPENSISAQLRNLKKVGWSLERRHVSGGLFEYRLTPPVNPGVAVAMRKAA